MLAPKNDGKTISFGNLSCKSTWITSRKRLKTPIAFVSIKIFLIGNSITNTKEKDKKIYMKVVVQTGTDPYYVVTAFLANIRKGDSLKWEKEAKR